MTESEMFAAVLDILAKDCAFTPEEEKRERLRGYFLSPDPNGFKKEWCFMGNLGYGGKLNRIDDRFYVSCYIEDRTALRTETIDKVNEKLKDLRDAYRNAGIEKSDAEKWAYLEKRNREFKFPFFIGTLKKDVELSERIQMKHYHRDEAYTMKAGQEVLITGCDHHGVVRIRGRNMHKDKLESHGAVTRLDLKNLRKAHV